jgi:hypothetical protein
VRVIKLGIISFVILFLLLTAISFFIPPQIRVTRALQMNAPAEKIWVELNNPAAWRSWFPGLDSAKLYYENGKPTGIIINEDLNRLIRIYARDDFRVAAEYKGIKQKRVLTGWVIHLDTNQNPTVEWYTDFHLRWYPWEKFSSILFEKQYGPQMEQGLERLKNRVESK